MDDLDPTDSTTWPEFLTTAQAGSVLAMSETQVRKLLIQGEIQGRRLGARWYVLKQPLLQPDAPEHTGGEESESPGPEQ